MTKSRTLPLSFSWTDGANYQKLPGMDIYFLYGGRQELIKCIPEVNNKIKNNNKQLKNINACRRLL